MSTAKKTTEVEATQKPVATAPLADTAALPTVTDVPAPVGPEQQNPVPATNRDTPILIKDVSTPDAPAHAPVNVVELATAAVTPTVNVTVKTPDEPKLEGKTVKVKFLRSHPSFGYFAGQEAEISQEAFDKHDGDGPFFEKL